jgi:hypothetical protein
MEIRPGSNPYDTWGEQPLHVFMKVYYFNCTNHEDVINHGAKPL